MRRSSHFIWWAGLTLSSVASMSCGTQQFDSNDKNLRELIKCAESSGDPNAIGPAGERGLYQFSAKTWHWATTQIYGAPLHHRDAHDPRISEKVADWYLRWLTEQIPEQYLDNERIVVAWNWGIGNLRRNDWVVPNWFVTHPNLTYRALFEESTKR